MPAIADTKPAPIAKPAPAAVKPATAKPAMAKPASAAKPSYKSREAASDMAFLDDLRASARKMRDETRQAAEDTAAAKEATGKSRSALEKLASEAGVGYKSGGKIQSRRGDGICVRGGTKGRFT
jgi:hypothetical protein